MSSSIPEQFGRYRILKLLGQGGMGAVYLAQDASLGRDVALKIPALDGPDAEQMIERFSREARAAATLHHPNICPVYDVGEIDGKPYLTMRYIEGRPLTKFINPEKPQNPRNVAVVRKLRSEVFLRAPDRQDRPATFHIMHGPPLAVNSKFDRPPAKSGEVLPFGFSLAVRSGEAFVERFRPPEMERTRAGKVHGLGSQLALLLSRLQVVAGPLEGWAITDAIIRGRCRTDAVPRESGSGLRQGRVNR